MLTYIFPIKIFKISQHHWFPCKFEWIDIACMLSSIPEDTSTVVPPSGTPTTPFHAHTLENLTTCLCFFFLLINRGWKLLHQERGLRSADQRSNCETSSNRWTGPCRRIYQRAWINMPHPHQLHKEMRGQVCTSKNNPRFPKKKPWMNQEAQILLRTSLWCLRLAIHYHASPATTFWSRQERKETFPG